MERIGIYGGTFDPIHTGHLILARDAVEQLDLSRMIFVPAARSPHKLDRAPGAPGKIRLEMLRAAVAGEKKFAVDPCELRRAPPSFAIDTVEEFRARWPEARFYYLIGADNVTDIDTWHRIGELRARVTFVVFHRRLTGSTPALAARGTRAAIPAVRDRRLTGSTPASAADAPFPTLERIVDLSSTEIRNRVASGRSIRYLVPESVAALIDAHGLYRNPLPQGGDPSLPLKTSSESVRSTPPRRKP